MQRDLKKPHSSHFGLFPKSFLPLVCQKENPAVLYTHAFYYRFFSLSFRSKNIRDLRTRGKIRRRIEAEMVVCTNKGNLYYWGLGD
jgi:hypothetical protein